MDMLFTIVGLWCMLSAIVVLVTCGIFGKPIDLQIDTSLPYFGLNFWTVPLVLLLLPTLVVLGIVDAISRLSSKPEINE